MGTCASVRVGADHAEPGERDKHFKIEEEIKVDKDQKVQCIKLLLLGSGECGKSTILKQMKILHIPGGFTMEERVHYADIIMKNTLTSIQTLVRAARTFDMPLTTPLSMQYATLIDQAEVLFPAQDMLEAILHLWTQESTIQQVLQRQSEYTLLDSAPFFLDNIERILSPNYEPSDQDILRSRMPTVGIIETDFFVDAVSGRKGSSSEGISMSGRPPPKLHFKFVDVGGQRGERKKWIHCFEGVRAILFIASLNEFDQMLAEDRSKNRLQESLQLFEGIIHLPWFQKTSIILFLNKHDLFKEKIKTVDLGAYFPSYSGGHSYEDALSFLKELFFSRNKDSKKTIYAHCTDATDTHGMKFVWKATKHIVMKSNLLSAGLI